jgi:UDP-glucose 4-epimerase
MIRIGITGAEGFVGGHLARFLGEKPGISVECFDRNRFDLRRPDTLVEFVRGKDCIIHLASIIIGSQEEMWINEYGTYNLIQSIRKTDSQRVKFIFISTVQVYGYSDRSRFMDEDSELNPANFHSYSKIICERTGLLFKDVIEPIILRFTNVYGFGCRPNYNSVVATFLDRIDRSERILLNNGGRQERDFLYVRDACEIIYRFVIKKNCSHRIYNVTSGRQVTIMKVIELIAYYLDREARIEYRSIDEPVNRLVVDNRRLLGEIGPYVFTGLESGLKEYIDEYRKSNSG